MQLYNNETIKYQCGINIHGCVAIDCIVTSNYFDRSGQIRLGYQILSKTKAHRRLGLRNVLPVHMYI